MSSIRRRLDAAKTIPLKRNGGKEMKILRTTKWAKLKKRRKYEKKKIGDWVNEEERSEEIERQWMEKYRKLCAQLHIAFIKYTPDFFLSRRRRCRRYSFVHYRSISIVLSVLAGSLAHSCTVCNSIWILLAYHSQFYIIKYYCSY